MTIKECIDIVDNLKPNQYTIKEKVMWLSFIELRIINDVLKTHEGYDGRYDLFTGYSEDKLTVTMIAPSPYDRLYTKYLEMKIDEANGETTRYNNSAILFNGYMADYEKYYNKTHMPISPLSKSNVKVPTTSTVGLSEAEYENLKRDLTYVLTEYFSDTVSADKLSGVINTFVLNNIEMLKGKPGYTPVKGVDYFTDADKAEIREYVNTILEETLKKVNEVVEKVLVRKVYINLPASAWVENAYQKYSQVVSIKGTTPNSQFDLQITDEQLDIFREKEITFWIENENGVVTVGCMGQRPTNDYVIQVTKTEVVLDE